MHAPISIREWASVRQLWVGLGQQHPAGSGPPPVLRSGLSSGRSTPEPVGQAMGADRPERSLRMASGDGRYAAGNGHR